MRKGLSILFIAIFIGAFASYGLVHADVSSAVARCVPVGNAPALCQDLGRTIKAFQQQLGNALLSFCVVIAACVCSYFVLANRRQVPALARAVFRSRSLLPRDPLRLAFARGILHSKAY